ncbi:MAG: hypothetical protein M3362_25075, partial [Acidobacteriota bacterium]|nr:hypothetical protein [Acidobacteriota bacterium]
MPPSIRLTPRNTQYPLLSRVRRSFVFLCLASSFLVLACSHAPQPRPEFKRVRTLAGADSVRFGDPFGVACSQDGTIYVSDGEAGRVWQIAPEGSVKSIAENLNTPSAIALTPDGAIVVADTGSHTIKRIVPQTGSVTVIAGTEGRAGFKDGRGAEALFNGPIGVAVGRDGTIFVADTYNDRIRSIDELGEVRTIAGGDEPGFADAANGADARFDTPCGIAVDVDGTLIVADTGNNRLRRVRPDGAVTTIAGGGIRGSRDGAIEDSTFNEPAAVAVDDEGTIYVADAGGPAIRVCSLGLWPSVTTLAGRADSGPL